MRARELMTRNPTCCTPDTPLREIARMMVNCNCGEIPVVDSKESMRPIGVVTDRDIVCRMVAEDKNPLQFKAADCMSTPCITISQDASVDECCELMERHMIRRIPVVDDQGRCCGIISQADLANKVNEVAADVLRQVSQPTREPSNVQRR